MESERNPTACPVKWWVLFAVIVGIGVAVGVYASMFFTKKFFLEDLARMNEPYKQVLFQTGQSQRALAQEYLNSLKAEFSLFSAKYREYTPYILRGDTVFRDDLNRIEDIIGMSEPLVLDGSLPTAHTQLELLRPILQDILKRNGFSMLSVALVDFHDAMEVVIAASDAKDAAGVITAYVDANEKLLEVERYASDAEIMTIRARLDELLALAKRGAVDALSAKAAELKSSFVKVYLIRG